jgi:cobalt-zinc-cadmium efflux system protein
LRLAAIITACILLAELLGGWWSGSLALLADAGHMFSDLVALAISWFALWFSDRPAPSSKSFGYYRMEILSALANGLLLVVLALVVFAEGWKRLRSPPEVHTTAMIWVAVLGLSANLVAVAVLRAGARHSLNVRSALAHLVGDTLSSLGVIAGGVTMAVTGWYLVDPLLSMFIALVILVGAWRLLREAVDVLLEAVPGGLDLANVARSMAEVPGVHQVHDLHIWSITSGMPALSGHVVTTGEPEISQDELLNRVKEMLMERYHIEHTTLQVESSAYREVGHVH